MTIVDSCGWIEYLADSRLASQYEKYLQKPEKLITPSVVLYEVYKKVKRERGEDSALSIVAQIEKTKLVPLDEEIALLAADLSLTHSLPLADAVVYATALRENVEVVSSDSHFKELGNVVFLE